MKSKFLRYGFIVFVLSIIVSCNGGKQNEKKLLLPVFGEKQASENGTDTVYHTIGNFSFTNQFGETVTDGTLKNKIYVADFFFATCQSICPVMSTRMQEVQESFKNDSDVMILSHTVNPMHDTVEVLHEYGKRYGAVKNKWHLVTGEKKKIYDLAKYGYLVNALEDDGSPEGFLHSELFLLIDRQQRIRGMYDGTDSAQVIKLIGDIKILKTEL